MDTEDNTMAGSRHVIASEKGAMASESNAMTTVISTPELLELILWHLNPKTLLRSKQVCKYFRAVLNSPTLSRALYLEAAPTSLSRNKDPEEYINPLLVTRRPALVRLRHLRRQDVQFRFRLQRQGQLRERLPRNEAGRGIVVSHASDALQA